MQSVAPLAAAIVASPAAASQPSQRNALSLPAATGKEPEFHDRRCDIELPKIFDPWIPSEGAREIVRALDAEERSALQARSAVLKDGLAGYRPDERNAVDAATGAMLGGFRAMKHQYGDDAEAVLDALAGVLREFPLWAIEQGCLKVARNQAGLDRRYAPNDTEICDVVRELVRPYRVRLESAEALLNAPVRRAITTRKPDLAAVEVALGRPLPRHAVSAPKPTPAARHDGNHYQRVAADLARRKANARGDPVAAET